MEKPTFDWCLDDGQLVIGLEIDGVDHEYVIDHEDLLNGLKEDLLAMARERSSENLAAMQEWSDYKMALRNLLNAADKLMTYGVQE